MNFWDIFVEKSTWNDNPEKRSKRKRPKCFVDNFTIVIETNFMNKCCSVSVKVPATMLILIKCTYGNGPVCKYSSAVVNFWLTHTNILNEAHSWTATVCFCFAMLNFLTYLNEKFIAELNLFYCIEDQCTICRRETT